MARAGDVLDMPALGVRVEFRRTAEQTGGELVEFDLGGRPKGFITVPHVHPTQTERHEVIEGRFRIRTGALERVLAPGDVVETAPGVEHIHGRRTQTRRACGSRSGPRARWKRGWSASLRSTATATTWPAGGPSRSPPPACCSTSR